MISSTLVFLTFGLSKLYFSFISNFFMLKFSGSLIFLVVLANEFVVAKDPAILKSWIELFKRDKL